MLDRTLVENYKEAVRLTQKGGSEMPEAAAMVVLADVLLKLPAQTFTVETKIENNELTVLLGGADSRHTDPVQVEKVG